MSTICIHGYVSGKVQGVWFRQSTQTEAIRLGITGWVRNLPDGRVEVFACGEKEVLETFQAWLKVGPPLASVTDIECEVLAWQEIRGFEVV